MSAGRHTPEPWFYHRTDGGFYLSHVNDDETVITSVLQIRSDGLIPSEPDAHLIAAAPELLSALDGLCSIREEMRLAADQPVGRVLYHGRLFREARAAIRRARGED